MKELSVEEKMEQTALRAAYDRLKLGFPKGFKARVAVRCPFCPEPNMYVAGYLDADEPIILHATPTCREFDTLEGFLFLKMAREKLGNVCECGFKIGDRVVMRSALRFPKDMLVHGVVQDWDGGCGHIVNWPQTGMVTALPNPNVALAEKVLA